MRQLVGVAKLIGSIAADDRDCFVVVNEYVYSATTRARRFAHCKLASCDHQLCRNSRDYCLEYSFV